MSVLVVEHLARYFPGAERGRMVRAVNDVSFEIAAGETVAMVGESGSGKSTIGRLALRLDAPTSGRIRFEGNDITNASAGTMRPLRARMQMVFQDPWGSLNPRMSVGTLIEEPFLLHTPMGRGERARAAGEIAEKVRLDQRLLERYPAQLSGGQLQRVAIARALALKPRLVVLDEPTSSLDLSVRAEILNLLANLQRETQSAFLFITHDLGTVRVISNRVLVLYLGQIVEAGPTATIFAAPAHRYTRTLLAAHLPTDPRIRPERNAAT